MPASEWLAVLDREYLRGFIPDGGAAVKVAASGDQPWLASTLTEAGTRAGLAVAEVGEQVARVYSMDKLVHAVAAQLDWDRLATEVMRQALQPRYRLPEGAPDQARVAQLNGIDEGLVAATCEQLVTRQVLGDHRMHPDFRVAMGHLCLSVVRGDDLSREIGARVTDWLRGDLRTIGTLRRARIYERITRYSARMMLSSMAHWVRCAGHAGLLVTVDVGRFATSTRRAGPDGQMVRPPSVTAVTDTYEMMRQCIDGTDEAEGLLLVFLTTPAFVTDERRGMRYYPALELRLADDVGDRRRGNPFAPLVRLEGR